MTARTATALTHVLRPWHLIILAWVAAYITRPFLLGFYDDDWFVLLLPTLDTAPFSRERFLYLADIYANRPGTGFLAFIMSSLCAGSRIAWHIAIAILALGTATALRSMFRALLRLTGNYNLWAADVASALWLVFPWTLGSIARPVCAPNVATVLLFAICARKLFDAWHAGRITWKLPLIYFTLSMLTYEALWGQIALVFAIGLLCGVHQRTGLKPFILSALPFAFVQLAIAAWNRVVPLLNDLAPSKTFCPIWPSILLDNLHRLRYFIGHSARELFPGVELLLAAILAACGTVMIYRLCRNDDRRAVRRSIGVLLIAGAGIFIGLVVLSIAGYVLRGAGLGSRTTLAFSFWLAVIFAVALGSLPPRQRLLHAVCVAGCLLLGTAFATATQFRLQEWGQAWDIQQDILDEVPLLDLADAQPGAIVLFMGPERHRGVRTFGYIRNLDRAISYARPQLRHLHFYCAARDYWVTSWDGRNFEQRRAKVQEWERRKVWNQFETPEVWVWVWRTGRARRVVEPFTYAGATNDNTRADKYEVPLPFVFADDPQRPHDRDDLRTADADRTVID